MVNVLCRPASPCFDVFQFSFSFFFLRISFDIMYKTRLLGEYLLYKKIDLFDGRIELTAHSQQEEQLMRMTRESARNV
jgi:hypothetical protein